MPLHLHLPRADLDKEPPLWPSDFKKALLPELSKEEQKAESSPPLGRLVCGGIVLR